MSGAEIPEVRAHTSHHVREGLRELDITDAEADLL
jgi:hypothetical protein